MITSMTGFASATHEAEGATTSVTVKSVNHRFLDVQLRVPSSLAAAENALRTQIQQRLARGRVEVTVGVQTRRVTTPTVELDEAFASRIAAAIERAREIGVVSGALQPGDLLRFPQALAVREAPVASPEDEAAQLKRGAETALAAALEALDAMRRREGELLRADLDARRGTLAAAIERVADAAAQGQGILRTRLHERDRRSRQRPGPRSGGGGAGSGALRGPLGHQRGARPVPRPPRTLERPHRRARAVRAEARLPAPGDEPRGEHHRVEVGRAPGLADHRGHEGGAGADARAGTER